MARGRPGGAEATRAAIVAAAMAAFAEKGFAATGIREIATRAGTNVASIAYHFGGKDGLRRACAGAIVTTMAALLDAEGPVPTDRAAARRLLAALVRRMSGFLLLDPAARPVAGFILREMSDQSEALDLIYDGLIARVHRRACAIWGAATGRDPESERVRLAVFTMVGQIIYFHLGRPVVGRRMGWTGFGPAEAAAVDAALARSLDALLDAETEPTP